MITIPITYTGLTPSMTEAVEIVSGQRETLAVAFSFSEDWNAYTLRTAMFSSRTATRAQMIEEDGTAVIPSEVIRNGERYVKISAFGTLERADGEIERYNGRAITLRIDIGGDVEESGGCTDATAYEKLLVRVTALEKRVDNLPAGGGGGGTSVELDTTLTQPGKAADAKAVGDAIEAQNDAIAKQNNAISKKLDAKELPAAVETALAEAKESGEFDGPPGRPGVSGVYVGSGDMPDGYNVQIDPSGNAVTMEGLAEELADMVDVPEKLPNPNALTFTGAVSGTYDGSEPLTVEIPSGGGGTGGASVELDSTLTEQGKAADAAAVGDALSLKADVTSVPNSATVNADNELVMQHTDGDAVAELFKVALPAGGGGTEWELIRDETLAEDVNEFTVSGIDYADVVAIIYPFKMNNATGDGATEKKLNPYVAYNNRKAQIMNLPINSTRNYVIVSQKTGSARLTQAYGVPTDYYYETGAPAFHIRHDDLFWAGRINSFSISLVADWYIKAGVRIAIFGRG